METAVPHGAIQLRIGSSGPTLISADILQGPECGTRDGLLTWAEIIGLPCKFSC
jgi:hypothetical protein